jgi:hypothetical protein
MVQTIRACLHKSSFSVPRTSPRELIDEDEIAHHGRFAWSPDARRIAFDRLSFSVAPPDEGVYLKTIGRLALTRVIGGEWLVLAWAAG